MLRIFSIRSFPSPSSATHLPLRRPFSSTLPRNSLPPPSSLLSIENIPAPLGGYIRVISLNSPANRNALSKQLVSELGREIRALGAGAGAGAKGVRAAKPPGGKGGGGGGGGGDLTRCLIIASKLDFAYCSGADLKERREMSREDTINFLTTLRQTFNNLSSLPIPSIAAISSLALGGGLELALACTFRVFSDSATVGLPESRLAIIPGAGGTYRLPRLIGEARAMEMILTGRSITGARAWEMGMCEKVVKVTEAAPEETTEIGQGWRREAVLVAALETALQICKGAPGVVGPAMRAVKAANEQAENEEYNSILDTEDRLEGLAAFAEKREPIFHGR